VAEPAPAERPYRAARAALDAALEQTATDIARIRSTTEQGRQEGAGRWHSIGEGLINLWHSQVGTRPRLRSLRWLARGLRSSLKKVDPALAELGRRLRLIRTRHRRLRKIPRRSRQARAIRLRMIGLRLRLNRGKLLVLAGLIGVLVYLWLGDSPFAHHVRDLWQLALLGWDLA
jgi:hypothetical protein